MASYLSQLETLIRRRQPFTTGEAQSLGVSASLLAYYCKQGKIKRICHGVYEPQETEINPYSDAEILVKKNIEFTICLLSALQFHEFTTQLPNSLWIAVPYGARIPKVENAALSCIRLTEDPYSYGVEQRELYGMPVKVYSAAKTVADCFKFRNKIGLDVALEALREGIRGKRFTIPELTAAAKVCRVLKIITPYAESILE
jgi:predicted transcriptional regulator of viral defense system